MEAADTEFSLKAPQNEEVRAILATVEKECSDKKLEDGPQRGAPTSFNYPTYENGQDKRRRYPSSYKKCMERKCCYHKMGWIVRPYKPGPGVTELSARYMYPTVGGMGMGRGARYMYPTDPLRTMLFDDDV